MDGYLRPDQFIDQQTVIKTKDFLEWVGVEKLNLEGLKSANYSLLMKKGKGRVF